MADDKRDKLKKYLPYIFSGASIAISCYSLYQSSQQIKKADQRLSNQAQISFSESSKSTTYDAPSYEDNEDMCGTASLSRIMAPDDANSAGNVHGGTILKMIGQTGWLSATRFINRNIAESKENDSENQYFAALVRMESMDFKLPMYIGEICTCNAKVTFTSNRSLETQVTVIAENAITGKKRITNSARMWFVGLKIPKKLNANDVFSKQQLIKIPPLQNYKMSDYEQAKQRYLKQKTNRNQDEHIKILNAVDLNEWTDRILSKDKMDKERGRSTVFKLTHITLPSDCFGTATRVIDGGHVMKLMDNAAGCVAHSWSRSRVVTISISAINFHAPIKAGNVCHCYARLIFTSRRSMEVFVVTFVHCQDEEQNDSTNMVRMLGQYKLKLVATSFFTFVALNEHGKSMQVPKFLAHSKFEKMCFNQAQNAYEERRNLRRKNQEKNVKMDDNEKNKYKPTVVVGPSGVGKGTLLAALRKKYPNRFAVAVSHTTRKARNGEEDGKHYYFVSKEEFENEIREEKFIEYCKIYGNLYGTSKQSVKDVMNKKQICLLEIDYEGAKLIKASKIDANYLFITVTGEEKSCKQRIESRGTETAEQIERRVKTAKKEFEFFRQNADFFDASICNDNLEQATNDIIQLFGKWYSWL